MDQLAKQILGSFALWQKDSLDLHTLFEAGGNDPERRTAVFDTVERLVKEGLLQEEGNDFYALTENGRKALQNSQTSDPKTERRGAAKL